MDDVRQGRICRELRRRARLTQRGLGRRCGLSQQAISLIERGHGSRLSGSTMRRLFAALDARWEPTISWRGGELDRLLDARHARVVATTVALLRSRAWQVDVEVTSSSYGERGSIDILVRAPTGHVALVVEIKSDLVSVEATLRKLDEKVRLVGDFIARERFGDPPAGVARLVVLPAVSTARRHVLAGDDVLRVALPARGSEVRAWLRRPAGSLAGVLFVSDTNGRGARRGRPAG